MVKLYNDNHTQTKYVQLPKSRLSWRSCNINGASDNMTLSNQDGKEISRKKCQDTSMDIELSKRINPKLKNDFDVLYKEICVWRDRELTKISVDSSLVDSFNPKLEVLSQETNIIRRIQHLYEEAKMTQQKARLSRKLKCLSSNKNWKLSNVELIEVQTPSIKRSRELVTLYDNLNDEKIHQDGKKNVR
mmetsp:Transcript_18252/g.25755  ORF Transcript_18252/g.25755 Transcript_18252/m.25755 type:complete len:189 (-) Transcript_18252:434-1000(-)